MIEKYFFLKINSIINFFLIYTYQINGVVFLNLKNLLIICCSLLRTRLVLSVLILFTLGLFSSLQAQQTYAQIANAGTPTAEQQTFANNSVASSYYSQAALVSIQPLLTRLGDSIITFSLPTSNTIYQAKKVNTASTSSPYYDEIWMGNLDDGQVGNVMFIRKDQLLSGFIHTEDSFFSIVPVADHTAFLLMHEVDYYDNFNCGNEQPTSVGEGNIIVGQCADSPNNCNVNVDVSVLMSDPAIAFSQNIPGASTNPFIPILYTLIGLESANFALINSDVDNFRFRFTIERFFFVFTPNNNLGIDLENFRDDGDAENRRDELGGDLAIMLTNQGYGTTFGIVSAIGPDDDNAYAIVEMPFLINPRWTFAHELAHLLGARHNRTTNEGTDDTSICSHGWRFYGGSLGEKRTLLANTGSIPPIPSGTGVFDFIPGGRLLNYSNPEVSVDGGATGTNDDNNALTMRNTACDVTLFRPDPQLHIALETSEEVCMQDIIMATVFIYEPNTSFPGQPPYTISWNQSSSNASTVFIPVQVSFPQQTTITVTVTSSDGIVLSKSSTVDIVNCSEHQGLSADAEELPRTDKVMNDEASVTLYPNPTRGLLTITFPTQQSLLSVQIMEVNGRRVDLEQTPLFGKIECQTANLLPGMYFAKMLVKDRTIIKSFVKH